jgi:2-dehydro-3-deoxygluconokinase
MELFPDVRQVYNTFRFETNELQYFATLNTGPESFVSTTYHSPDIVDKVGSGDCFMAGIIHGTINKKAPQDILDFCASAAFQKLFTKGDTNTRTPEEIVLFSASYAT